MFYARAFMTFGALAGFSGVVIGALTAHFFRARLDAAAVTNLQTASLYLLVHGLLLIFISQLCGRNPGSVLLPLAGGLCVLGTLGFCGGISMSAVTGVRHFAMVAPPGGLALMGSWLSLALYGIRQS